MELQQTESNDILASLSLDQQSGLNRYGEDVPLNVGSILTEPSQMIDHIYFVRSGLVSLLVVLPDKTIADAGFVDHKAAIGCIYDVDSPISFTRDTVSAKGRALRISRENFEAFKHESVEFRRAIDKCCWITTARSQQAAACNLIHRLEERLCRWLLQISDASCDSDVVVTQDHLSHILGVNRTRLNEAVKSLQTKDAISQAQRGVFRIKDVKLIAAQACGCYTATKSMELDKQSLLRDICRIPDMVIRDI